MAVEACTELSFGNGDCRHKVSPRPLIRAC